MSAFHGICDPDMGVVTVYAETKTISQSQSQSSGSFLVDSSLGRDTVFGIIVEDEEDHLIDNVVFENSHGEVYGEDDGHTDHSDDEHEDQEMPLEPDVLESINTTSSENHIV